MAIDSIIRVSFQTSPKANQAANKALVGHPQDAKASGPFERINTAVYSASAKDDAEVLGALAELAKVMSEHSTAVDFLSVSLTKR